MNIDAKQVMLLREKTGLGMMECKGALAEAGCDIEKAIDILRKKGVAKAIKKAGRSAGMGLVSSYIHQGGKIGVLLEVNCETDFVARTEAFQGLVHDLAMHVAAANPLYLQREDIPPEVISKEREIYKEQAAGTNKPAQVIEKIIDGKLDKYCKETCLLEQLFIKDDTKTIKDLVHDAIGKLGENIVVRRFQRYQLGEGI